MKFLFVIPKFMRFAIVGVINTSIDLFSLNILIAVFGFARPDLFPLYKGFSFFCALINSYFMNKYFTFNVKETRKYAFQFFVFFSLIGLLINVSVSSFVFNILLPNQISSNVHILATVSSIFGVFLGLIVNFISYNYFVFK